MFVKGCIAGRQHTEKSGTEADFTITDPELWWTYELSGKAEQPLYEISAAVVSGGKEVDSTSKKMRNQKD